MATIVPASNSFSKGFAIGSSVMELAIKAKAARQAHKRAEQEHQMKIQKYTYDIKAAQLAIVGKEKDIQQAAMTEMRTQLDRMKANWTSMGEQGTSLIAQGQETKQRISGNMTGGRTILTKEEMAEMREADRMILAGQNLQTQSQVGLTNLAGGNKMSDSQRAELSATISRGKDVSRLTSAVVPATAFQSGEIKDMDATVKPHKRAAWNQITQTGDIQKMRAFVANPQNAYDPVRLKTLTNATQLIATPGFQMAAQNNPTLQEVGQSITAEVLGIATGNEFKVETTEGGFFKSPTATITKGEGGSDNTDSKAGPMNTATGDGKEFFQFVPSPGGIAPTAEPAGGGAKSADQQMQDILRQALQGE